MISLIFSSDLNWMRGTPLIQLLILVFTESLHAMSGNPFLQPLGFYQRDLNPLRGAVNQMATALSVNNNTSYEEARQFVGESIRSGAFPLNNPNVEYYGRNANGDRTQESQPLLDLLKEIVENFEIMVPTMTTYCHPDTLMSPLSSFIAFNVDKRAAAKHEQFKAEQNGDVFMAFRKKIEQTNKKENNNSASGAMATFASILANETGHNTLTSITRSMASIANALNERMISGNRHYHNREIAINNAIAIISTMDEGSVREACQKYKLHLPSPMETLEVFMKSLRYYDFDRSIRQELFAFFCQMTGYQRAACVYTQDLYHLRKFNPTQVRELLEALSNDQCPQQFEEPAKVIKSNGGAIMNYSHQVLIYELQGKGTDYQKMEPALVNRIANVSTNIAKTVESYRSMINAFFLAKTVPSSTAYIKDMVRDNVVLSDTDSTMFAIDEWVINYFGELQFTQKAFGIAGAVMYLSSSCIAHCLAILSANMGVSKDHLFTLEMKPEFVFPVFGQSPVSKHYFTAQLVKEGSVLPKIKMEIKGVHNISSAQPSEIIQPTHKLMEELIANIMRGEKIDIHKEIHSVYLVEQQILDSVRNGESTFYKRINIKEPTAYSKGPMESNFSHYTMWQTVFAAKYGDVSEPPYDALKIPTIINSVTKWKKWLAEIKDRDIAQRMESWALSHNKKLVSTFFLSMDQIEMMGIPDEILPIIDYKRILLDLTNSRRMLLDTCGHTLREGYTISELGYDFGKETV